LRRHLTACAAGLVAVVGGMGASPSLAQSSAPSAPTALSVVQVQTSSAIAAGSWINRSDVNLRFSVQVTNGALTPQVEIEPTSQPFTGTPNFSAAPLNSSGTAVVHVTGLLEGRTYHWQARVADASGATSSWSAFSSGASSDDFGVDMVGPARPTIRSTSNPNPNKTYDVRVVDLRCCAGRTSSNRARPPHRPVFASRISATECGSWPFGPEIRQVTGAQRPHTGSPWTGVRRSLSGSAPKSKFLTRIAETCPFNSGLPNRHAASSHSIEWGASKL
jgi:hypothetical protein